jgi:hypothetical protein
MNDCHQQWHRIPAIEQSIFLGVSMKKVIEIRAAEGGEDSALFAHDLAQAYQRHFIRVG